MKDIVLHTANILEIGGLEVFVRAYKSWHGADNKRAVEIAYSVYFNRGNPDIMPYWVRHYCRNEIAKFLEREKTGDAFMPFIRWCIAKVRLLRTTGTSP